MNTEFESLRTRIADLAVAAGDGDFTSQDLNATGGSLQALGFSSLSYMRLVDAIENELGVYIEPGADAELLTTVDGIATLAWRAPDDASV